MGYEHTIVFLIRLFIRHIVKNQNIFIIFALENWDNLLQSIKGYVFSKCLTFFSVKSFGSFFIKVLTFVANFTNFKFKNIQLTYTNERPYLEQSLVDHTNWCPSWTLWGSDIIEFAFIFSLSHLFRPQSISACSLSWTLLHFSQSCVHCFCMR